MREKWIDAVKAIAIIFVLMGHAGISIFYFGNFAVLFYVPVFFVLSGYLHHHREEERYLDYAKRRARRLLFPYFGYSLFLLLFYTGKEAFAGRLQGETVLRAVFGILYARYQIRLDPPGEPLLFVWNSPMWFLPALFLTDLLFEGCFRLFNGSKKAVYGACLGCGLFGILIGYRLPILLPWSMDTALIVVLLMMAGYWLKEAGAADRLKQQTKGKKALTVCGLFAAALVLSLLNGSFNISLRNLGHSALLGVLTALCASLCVMALCFLLQERLPEGLCLIGQNTMPVLCLHLFVFMFLQAGMQIALSEFLRRYTILGAVAEIVIVFLTIDILVVGAMWWNRLCLPWLRRKRPAKEWREK